MGGGRIRRSGWDKGEDIRVRGHSKAKIGDRLNGIWVKEFSGIDMGHESNMGVVFREVFACVGDRPEFVLILVMLCACVLGDERRFIY